jgi:signal transduction histidine kinase
MDRMMQLSGLLASRRGDILGRWSRQIGRDHAEKALSRGELRDHLPEFFDEMVATLRSAEDVHSHDTAPSNGSLASVAHGAQRLRVGFDLTAVIHEYEVLTECILEEVEAAGGSLSITAFRRMQAVLNAGRAQAVSAYIDRRDAEIAHTHSQHVAFIAHELRSPLMGAFLSVAVLRRNERPEDQRPLELLDRHLTTLRELVDQVLTADRLAAQIQLRRESLDMRALLEQVVADTRLSAEHRHLEVAIQAPDALSFSGDQRLLRSAIGNVLGNAIKFSHEGSAITLRAGRDANGVTVQVEDRCGGLPEGNPTELFEPFVQRGGNRTGFGLGLAIVKQAIQAHGGKVSVDNLPGKGCVFSLYVPEPKGD